MLKAVIMSTESCLRRSSLEIHPNSHPQFLFSVFQVSTIILTKKFQRSKILPLKIQSPPDRIGLRVPNPILIIGFHQRNPWIHRVFLDSQGEFSQFGCFLKWWYPQNTPKWSFLVGKPMVVGYHHFWKHPFGFQGTHPWHFAQLRSTTIHHLPLATRHPVTPHAMLRHEMILIPWPSGVKLQSTKSASTPGGEKNSPKSLALYRCPRLMWIFIFDDLFVHSTVVKQ